MRAGEVVSDFELVDDHGMARTLSELLAAGPVVLFFYPAAFTSGCTAESCHFRDLATEFAALGAQPVGISKDPVERQREFSAHHGFPFPLLSDVDGAVARQFGVRRRLPILPVKRSTFVIDPDRRVRAVISNELHMDVHADRALKVLNGEI